ncbi:MAG: hypothetical protein AVW06_03270 [Hadesarchaea archaeon DG-33-1]|nr:MAG: hypothetical protein AVW06_03270 [Hadesarchaea archaeon DG-33-1]
MGTKVDEMYILSASIIFFALLPVLFLPFIGSGNAFCPLSPHSFQHTEYITSAVSVNNNLLRSCTTLQPPPSEDSIANGSFENSTDNWSFVAVAGAPMGSWDPAGYDNSGCAKIRNRMCRGWGRSKDDDDDEDDDDKGGEGYWEQTIFTTIEAGSTVKLSYAWKKNFVLVPPYQQDIYITLVKPDATIADIDSQLGAPPAYNTWYVVSGKNVSDFFNQTGTYKIRLRYDYKAWSPSALALAWFDEVKLLVTPPRSVEVSISPDNQSAWSGENLEYTVTVCNIGDLDDNYTLIATDTLSWTLDITPSILQISAGDCDNAKLTVTVGTGCDTITVTADGNYADNSNSCTAVQKTGPRVDVSITPKWQENIPGGGLEYTVVIKNMGTVEDNYDLTVSDNEDWALMLSDNSLVDLQPGENGNVSLIVTVARNALSCTEDNITVTVTSQTDNTVSDFDTCIAHAAIVRWVYVWILPTYQSGPPGATLIYMVTVTNAGNVSDTYTIENSDDAGWSLDLDEVSLTIPAGENGTTTLSVVIPKNATPSTADNVTVTVTSSENTAVSDNASCVAHLIIQALPGQPTLYLPAHGSKTNDNTPTFEWACGKNATNHRLLVDKDPDFSSPEVNHLFGVPDDTYTITTPLVDGNYSWKVIAINKNGVNESDIWTFIIDTIPPSAPTLLSPENNDNITDNTPTFRWTEPETPEKYTLVIDNDADFGSPIRIISDITDNTYTLLVELAVDNYYWRVRAIDEAGNAGDWAENFKLTILRGKVPRLPSKPQLYSPDNGSKVGTPTPTLRWENGLYAENHRVLVDIDNNPDDDPLYDLTVERDNKWTTPSLNDNTTYWWKVIAQNENGENHSVTWHFTVETGVPPAQPSARWPFVVGAAAAVTAGITAALYRKRGKNLRRTVLRRCSSG